MKLDGIRTARLRVYAAASVLALATTIACAGTKGAAKAPDAAASASRAAAPASAHVAPDAAAPKAIPQGPPSSAIVIVNVAAAVDERFSWILGNDAWDVAHMIARLTIGKDCDWLAFVHVPEDTERDLLVVHHHVDTAEMEQVLDLEGARDGAASDKLWRPRNAPRGFLISELDPSTLVFGFRKAIATKDEVARLRSMGELSMAPIHAVLVHKSAALADAGAPRTSTMHLNLAPAEKDQIDIKVTTDIEDIVAPEEVARTLEETLADYGWELGTKRGSTIFDRLSPDRSEHTWAFRGQVSPYDLPKLVQHRRR